MEALERAIAWQTAEPIRVDRPGSPGHGAVLHGIDKRRGRPLGLYTEITGYAVSLFTFLLRLGQSNIHRKAAMDAADYLVRIQQESGAYPHLPDPADRDAPWSAYSFDVAACIVGLARFDRVCPGKGYLDSAMAAARWLLGLQRADGSFFAMMVKGGELRDPEGFFGDGSCIHAKNAIALLELHAASGREEYRRAALKVCEHTLALQAPDGAFWSGPGARYVFSHAHAYACEGLLFAGAILREERFAVAARRGIDWLAGAQEHDGGWLSYYKTPAASRRRVVDAILRPRQSDAAAQAVRLFCLTGRTHEARTRAAVDFLLQCQHASGGFHYRRTRFGYSPFLNTWSAQFAVQALTWGSSPADAVDLF
jgi:prenyltransferase beta subunit